MKLGNLKSLLVCLVALLVFGCATTPLVRPEFCSGDKESRIYDLADKMHVDPQTVSSMMVIANYEALKHSPLYTEDACRGAIENVRLILTGNPTYYQVMMLITDNVKYVNSYAGAEIMLLGLFVPQLKYNIPITECDRLCILWHLDQQEKMLDSFFGKKK